MPNIVYIATSIDGYIADKNDGLDWLGIVPNPDGNDFGFAEFMDDIDAVLMGRKTFDVVNAFDGDWPYTKPVFVLTSTLKSVPAVLEEKVFLISGSLQEVFKSINDKGFSSIYIDGGKTIQSCLEEDLIDELILFQMPILLGGGVPLFGTLSSQLELEHRGTEVFLNAIVKSHYIRKR